MAHSIPHQSSTSSWSNTVPHLNTKLVIICSCVHCTVQPHTTSHKTICDIHKHLPIIHQSTSHPMPAIISLTKISKNCHCLCLSNHLHNFLHSHHFLLKFSKILPVLDKTQPSLIYSRNLSKLACQQFFHFSHQPKQII